VKDQGQGIPIAEQANLFLPFSKTSVKSTNGEKSTGLGLTIAKKVIEAHGGSIWMTSTVGQGSSFCFSLPLENVSIHQPAMMLK
jgi:signal transduction histidine kinase